MDERREWGLEFDLRLLRCFGGEMEGVKRVV